MANGLQKILNGLRLMDEATTAKAQPTSDDAWQSEQLYREMRNGPVTIKTTGNKFYTDPKAPTRKPAPAAPKVDDEVAFKRASEGLFNLSHSELKELREKQSRCDRAKNAATSQFTSDAAIADYQAAYKKAWEAFNLSDSDFTQAPTINRDEFIADYVEKRKIICRALDDLEADAIKFCTPIIQRFILVAAGELERLESTEAAECEKYGFAYQPGPRVQILRRLIEQLRARIKSQFPGTPKQILPFIQI